MSTDEGSRVSRRRFLTTASATAGVAATAGQAAAQEKKGDEPKKKPDFGGWLAGVDGGYKDLRGNKEVTVEVGAQGNTGPYAFKPAGIWVDEGTKVKWKWVKGRHNVVAESGPAKLDSGKPVSGTGIKYEYTFEKGGITKYFCEPHRTLGMKGAVAVGGDVPTVKIKENTSILPASAKAMGVAGSAAMASTLGLAYLFVKYGER